jgi:hypothetical protein
MSKFNLYLEKVIKKKEIINEKVTSEKENTILTKILNIKSTYEIIQIINKSNETIKNIIINSNESLKKILEPNNVAEIKEQYEILKEFFLKHGGIKFEKEDIKESIKKVIEDGDTNSYGNYDLGNLMSTEKFKKAGDFINSEFRTVSV